MRYRNNKKIKIKHDLIEGLLPFLKKISLWPEIKAINPGGIKPKGSRQGGALKLRVQYETKSGLKCIARSQGVQEVFLVSQSPALLREKLESLREFKL